jgi:hypothetical protein
VNQVVDVDPPQCDTRKVRVPNKIVHPIHVELGGYNLTQILGEWTLVRVLAKRGGYLINIEASGRECAADV